MVHRYGGDVEHVSRRVVLVDAAFATALTCAALAEFFVSMPAQDRSWALRRRVSLTSRA